MPVVPLVCLALACGWDAGILLSDDRRLRRLPGRAYRSGLGWLDIEVLNRWRRGYPVPLVAAAGLLVAAVLGPPVGSAVGALACGAVILWVAREGRFTHTRFAPLCLALLAAALLLDQLARLSGTVPPHSGALLASFCAAQLYLVAGLRKLRSPQFLSGRVVLDNLAYGAAQAAAGNRDFLPVLPPGSLATLVRDTRLQRGCRIAAIAATLAELILGLGAIGLIPPLPVLILAVLSHLGFLLMSPVRIMPFAIAGVGLLFLATTHPLLAGIS